MRVLVAGLATVAVIGLPGRRLRPCTDAATCASTASCAGGQKRNGVAAIDAGSGRATAWNPDVSALSTEALALSGQSVYVGGEFFLGSLNATTGRATGWNPKPDGLGEIKALAVVGQSVYVGGDFTSIGGQPQTGFAIFGL